MAREGYTRKISAILSDNVGKATSVRIVLCLVLVGLLIGCSGSDDSSIDPFIPGDTAIDPYSIEPSSIETFGLIDGEVCREDGKPVIRLFSTTWCSHCQWVADTFDAVMEMYIDDGEIAAHHWEVDTGDDALTSQVEQSVPDSETAIFAEFNPQESIPTFVFGCKYYRIGTGHEREDDLESEAAEFMAVIEALIGE